MDPITTSLKTFQDQVKDFRNDKGKLILFIQTESQHVELLLKMLRGEEWQPDNNSPLILFNTSCMKDREDTCDNICKVVKEHYSLLKKGFEKDSVALPNLEDSLPEMESDETGEILAAHLHAFSSCIKDHLSPPYVGWLPSNVRDRREWVEILKWLIEALEDSGIRFIFSIENEKQIKYFLKHYEDKISIIDYTVDDEETSEYFGKLFAPPSLGHAQGTPSGAAAPDVEPPPRNVQQIPNDEAAKAALASLNLPPYLTPQQSEKLEAAVFAAAFALGKQDEETAIARQTEACEICEEAGVVLEHAMMRLTLANYLLQFKYFEDAEIEFRKAEQLAVSIHAYPQIAQIRMALAFIYGRKKKTLEKSIYEYEQAAAAATIGESLLLYLESLRMAGLAHLKNKDSESAMLCWGAAVEKCRQLSKEEVRASSFLDIAANFIKVLEKNRLYDQAKYVENLVVEIGEQFQQ